MIESAPRIFCPSDRSRAEAVLITVEPKIRLLQFNIVKANYGELNLIKLKLLRVATPAAH